TTWDGIVYDPQTDLVIFGTGNGAPWPSEVRSPGGGDNLFIASIVAVEAKTGKYRWHYQTVPAENFDFDNTSPLINADANIGVTGKGWYIVPFQTHVWYPQSYNPNTGLMYFGVRYATYGMVSEAGAKMGNQLLSINIAKRPEMAAPKLDGAGMWLTAWDPVKQKEVWRSKEGTAGSGTMT